MIVSSHDLADVEALADHVVVIDKGKLVTQGPLEDLLEGSATGVVVDNHEQAIGVLAKAGIEAVSDEGRLLVQSEEGHVIIKVLTDQGIYPSQVAPARTTLESVFLGITGDGDL